jgi:hypothetical protein
LNRKARAVAGTPQGAATTFTSRVVLNGAPANRVSSTRQGVTVYKDSPPGPGGAKYPLMSITRSVASLANTFTAPLAKCANKTLALDPAHPHAREFLAGAYLKKGDFNRWLEECEINVSTIRMLLTVRGGWVPAIPGSHSNLGA